MQKQMTFQNGNQNFKNVFSEPTHGHTHTFAAAANLKDVLISPPII